MKKAYKICLIIFSLFMLTGCAKTTRVVLTLGDDATEVFRIEDMICRVPEVMVYMVNTENRYSELFSKEIWDVPYEGGTVESQYKETVLARLAQIKAMNLFAAKLDVTLSDEEKRLCKKAANEYYNSLSSKEIEYLDVTEELIADMYSEFALANKVYQDVVSKVNPEISDDEARSVTVKSLLIKTYTTDEYGDKNSFDFDRKQDALKRAYALLVKIRNGEDFDVVAADYNEDDKSLYSFGRGVMPEEIEEAAYNLSEGQVSDVIETEYGYHILKCVSNFDKESTDANKLTIVEMRKKEAFREEYDTFISELTSNLNEDVWNNIRYIKSDEITTTDFFEIYNRVFDMDLEE